MARASASLAVQLAALAMTTVPACPSAPGTPPPNLSAPPVDSPSAPSAEVAPPEVPPAPPLPPPPPVGALSGRVVVLSGGHGRLIHMSKDGRSVQGWGFQRDVQHGIREDLWTQTFVTDELAPRLEAMGATVLSLRERDRHDVSVVIDDLDPGFTAHGMHSRGESALLTGGGDVTLSPGGWASWRITAPSDGVWYLYARWRADPGHDPAAHYVARAGEVALRTDVDQRRHEGVWWPIGHLTLVAGEAVEVSLTGAGPLSADAIRLGGGSYTLDEPRLAPAPPVPWFEVSTSQHLPQLGGPASLLWLEDGARISDMRFRARWTTWATDPEDRPVFLSVHTNAGDGNGTIVFYGVDPDAVPPVPSRPESRSLATELARGLGAGLRTIEPRWHTTGPNPGNYSEISPFWSDVDGAMIEVGFHDDARDARWLRDERFQDAAADAIVAAVERWSARP